VDGISTMLKGEAAILLKGLAKNLLGVFLGVAI
jgi:hypothetical protein